MEMLEYGETWVKWELGLDSIPVRCEHLPGSKLPQSTRVLREERALLHCHILGALVPQEKAVSRLQDGAWGYQQLQQSLVQPAMSRIGGEWRSSRDT